MIWTEEQDTTLRTMRDEGRSYADIGKALGTTRNAVSGRVNRLKLPPRTGQYSAQMRWHGRVDADGYADVCRTWTREDDGTLIRMRTEGVCDAAIAQSLGRSLSSVRGRVARLGVPPRASSIKPAQSLPKPFTYRKGKATPPKFFAVHEAPNAVPVDLIERTGCCYPVTDHKPHMFCNAETESGDYCKFHRAVMYRVAA